jgi:hypothetical protein
MYRPVSPQYDTDTVRVPVTLGDSERSLLVPVHTRTGLPGTKALALLTFLSEGTRTAKMTLFAFVKLLSPLFTLLTSWKTPERATNHY